MLGRRAVPRGAETALRASQKAHVAQLSRWAVFLQYFGQQSSRSHLEILGSEPGTFDI